LFAAAEVENNAIVHRRTCGHGAFFWGAKCRLAYGALAVGAINAAGVFALLFGPNCSGAGGRV